MTQPLPDLSAGLHRHYKGPLYQAIGYGQDANYEGRLVVIYMGLELDEAHTGPPLVIRTALSDEARVAAWWDHVHADGTKCRALTPGSREVCDPAVHPRRPRFEYIGPSWEGNPPSS